MLTVSQSGTAREVLDLASLPVSYYLYVDVNRVTLVFGGFADLAHAVYALVQHDRRESMARRQGYKQNLLDPGRRSRLIQPGTKDVTKHVPMNRGEVHLDSAVVEQQSQTRQPT